MLEKAIEEIQIEEIYDLATKLQNSEHAADSDRKLAGELLKMYNSNGTRALENQPETEFSVQKPVETQELPIGQIWRQTFQGYLVVLNEAWRKVVEHLNQPYRGNFFLNFRENGYAAPSAHKVKLPCSQRVQKKM